LRRVRLRTMIPGAMLDVEDTKRRIAELQREHGCLDELIAARQCEPVVDELLLRRLKKRKLQVKDAIVQLQMQLTPDVPA
jgi:hypothetical protein